MSGWDKGLSCCFIYDFCMFELDGWFRMLGESDFGELKCIRLFCG